MTLRIYFRITFVALGKIIGAILATVVKGFLISFYKRSFVFLSLGLGLVSFLVICNIVKKLHREVRFKYYFNPFNEFILFLFILFYTEREIILQNNEKYKN